MLDPRDTAAAQSEPQPIGELPRALRTFGFSPSSLRLQPGDLILTAPVKPGWIATTIEAYQQSRFASRHAAWTHAAAHIEGGRLVEAVRRGIRPGHIYDYVPTHKILVRRFEPLDVETRLRLAVAVAMRIGQPYGTSSVTHFARSYLSRWSARPAVIPKQVICSQIYVDAFLFAVGRTLTNIPLEGPVTPAHLAACPDFVDIDMVWIKLG